MIRLIEILAAGVTDDSGNPLDSGQVYFYEAGTTTLQTVYEDFEQENPLSNPATLDAAGRLIAYAEDRVKLVIVDSDGATIRTIDDVGTSDSDITSSSVAQAAGNGLVVATDGTLAVNVDSTTITISSDQLQVAAAGIADDSTIEANSNVLRVKNGGITRAKQAALGQQVSSSCGSFTTSSGSYGDVTNLSVSITTSGRPVFLALISASGSAASRIGTNGSTGNYIKFVRDSTDVAEFWCLSASVTRMVPSLLHVDTPAAGTYAYKVQAKAAVADTLTMTELKLIAFEL